MCYTRFASANDLAELNRIAYESEAYWGYDEKHMEKFREIYSITEGFISTNPTVILLEGSQMIGFFAVIAHDQETTLEYFYLDPRYIGKGYGRKMWAYLLDYCKKAGIHSFSFTANPEAKGFYERMGAVLTGQEESLLRKGRIIPKLRFELAHDKP